MKIVRRYIEGIPLASPLKEMMEPLKSAFKIYSQNIYKDFKDVDGFVHSHGSNNRTDKSRHQSFMR